MLMVGDGHLLGEMLAVMAVVVTDGMRRGGGGSVGLCIQVIRRCHGCPLLLHTPPSAWVDDEDDLMPSHPRKLGTWRMSTSTQMEGQGGGRADAFAAHVAQPSTPGRTGHGIRRRRW